MSDAAAASDFGRSLRLVCPWVKWLAGKTNSARTVTDKLLLTLCLGEFSVPLWWRRARRVPPQRRRDPQSHREMLFITSSDYLWREERCTTEKRFIQTGRKPAS